MSGIQMTVHGKQAAGMAAAYIRVGACIILSSVIFPLHAEDLPDPTRPPASVFAPAAGTGSRATAKSSSGLQSIIISKTRRAAIIDGQTVELGGQHGNARLIEVHEGSVVLQRGQSRQVLSLFPGVKITNKDMTEKGSVKIESLNREMQMDQSSSASNVQPVTQGTGSAVPKEVK